MRRAHIACVRDMDRRQREHGEDAHVDAGEIESQHSGDRN